MSITSDLVGQSIFNAQHFIDCKEDEIKNKKILFEELKKYIINKQYVLVTHIFLNTNLNAFTKINILNELFVEICKIGDMNAFNFIIKYNMLDISYNSNLPFIMACENGHLPIVIELIKLGIKPHYVPEAVKRAAYNNKVNIISFLIEHHSNIGVSDSNEEIFRICCQHGINKTVEFLLKKGINIHALNDRALLVAILKRRVDTVKLLLKYGATVTAECLVEIKKSKSSEILEIFKSYFDNNQS